MNARQAKKRAKYCFYIGVGDAFLRKMEEIQRNAQEGKEICNLTLNPIPVGLGHNQHGFCKFANFGKQIIKRYSY